jgi:hypothetical protein
MFTIFFPERSRSDYSGTGANSEPFVPRKPGSGKFKAMAAEVDIDLSFLKRPTEKSEPSKPAQGTKKYLKHIAAYKPFVIPVSVIYFKLLLLFTPS